MQAVIAIAVVTALAWGFLGPEPRLTYALLNAVAVLIIACPCAVGLATPISITVAMRHGRAAGHFVPQRGGHRAPAGDRHPGHRQDRGTEIAMESAGVTLVKGDLRGIARATNLSRATMRNVRQNLAFAFGYNAIGIPVAAGVLYPAFGILLSPIFAGVAMAASSISVVMNALRLKRARS